MLSVGDLAPDFEATDQRGQRITLDGLVKDAAVVLYFYPKDFTPVCTQQACLFRDTNAELAAEGVSVVGVSADDTASHAKFAEANHVPYPLLSDPDRRIQKAFGARQVLGMFAKRVTYLIDQKKQIRAVYHHELSAQKHLDAVRQAIATL